MPRQVSDAAAPGGRHQLSAIAPSGIPFEALVEELERSLILRASYATKWNQSRTAELLNLKRDKLRYRMKLFGIHAKEDEAQDHSSAA